jgi:hypothetical protein
VKRNELKKVLKPLIKECIKEVIFEEGTLSGIITEVAQGLSSVQGQAPQPIVEKKVMKPNQSNQAILEARKSLEETKRSLQNSTGLKGIFEGTEPLHQSAQKSQGGALRDVDPGDPGVDISGIMKIAGGGWDQIT